MRRSLFLVLAVIALGTACQEEQCKLIPLGSPVSDLAPLGTFGACYFAYDSINDINNANKPGCFDGGWTPEGFDAGPNWMCIGPILDDTDSVGVGGGECAEGPFQNDLGECIVWERDGRVVGHDWVDFDD